MAFWKKKKEAEEVVVETARRRQSKKPKFVAAEVKLLSMEALEAGLNYGEVSELVGGPTAAAKAISGRGAALPGETMAG